MTTKSKNKIENDQDEPAVKKSKRQATKSTLKNKPLKLKKSLKPSKTDTVKTDKKAVKIDKNTTAKVAKKSFSKKTAAPGKFNESTEKPPDWNEFKKKKKELRVKRRQNRNAYDVVTQIKKIGELLRRKNLKGGQEERHNLVDKAHKLLAGKSCYPKFVLTHDMARIVQYILKFGTAKIRKEVAEELIPVVVEMLQSKYGKFCVKRILKYGDVKTRSSVIRSFYGNSVKLASHAVSASIVEYAYSTWATPLEKHHLVQEFFGDMYKQNKDDNIKHLSDVYKNSMDMKTAVLSATKSNLSRILNKNLYDSSLVQTVLHQFLSECNNEDKTELISQLIPHVVILSNSKDGARVAMRCIWQGSNKDKKVIAKALKEHLVDMAKHEHGHCTLITLLDTVDDTVLLNKIILIELLKHVKDLAADEWGRKIILWLVAPAESLHFHPVFIKELEIGREASTCKKSPEIRREEILDHSMPVLLNCVTAEPEFWLSNASLAVVLLAILKAGSGPSLEAALDSLSKIIVDPEWKIKTDDGEINGIEHTGLHVILKKLAQHDKVQMEQSNPTFGAAILRSVTDELLESWITLNRGCFLLVAVLENGTDHVREDLITKLKPLCKKIKKQTSTGAKVLIKKLT